MPVIHTHMDADLAIEVSGLGKKYRIGGLIDRHRTLRDSLSATLRRGAQALHSPNNGQPHPAKSHNVIWALRDVSFTVRRGEVLGVIGRNGAGKSTLLKVLTRITVPDEGYARIRGRVGSLLEVGTGFHLELTGRENTYLSGAVLGMRREEIDRKFDEIVEFAGVERFVDTPVKHYSTGMYLRLAFSVAAHLDPEILLVDEVLAVGDAEFQKKCLGKMSDVAGEGRTVLFVSHNMDAVRQLCHSALWLERGHLQQIGPTAEVIQAYLADTAQDQAGVVFPVMNEQHGIGFNDVRLTLLPTQSGAHDLHLGLEVLARQPIPRVGIGIELLTAMGARVAYLDERLTNFVFDMEPGINRFALECPAIDRLLAAGDYVINLWLTMANIDALVMLDRAVALTIPGTDLYGTGLYVDVHRHGPVLLPLRVHRLEPALAQE